MGGKLCIHPSQIDSVSRVFGYSKADKKWAVAVLHEAERHGGSVFAYQGFMVDAPVLARAQKILDLVDNIV
jgi:citrate lyase beta subunit